MVHGRSVIDAVIQANLDRLCLQRMSNPLSPRSHDASWMYFCVSAGLLWLAPPPEPQPQKPALPLGWPPFSQDSENVQLSVPWRAKIREGLLLLTRDTAGQNTQVDPGTRFLGVLLSKSVPE